MNNINLSLNEHLDSQPAWGVILHTLSAAVPDAIELVGLQGDQRSNSPSVKLEGIEYQSAQGGAIQTFLKNLQDSPLVDSVELGATHRTVTERGDARQFHLVVTLIPTDLQDWKEQKP